MFKKSILILVLFSIFSCGKNADEKIVGAILSANIALSKGDCQSAITTLEDVGRQNQNAAYVKTLASAYACRSGFSVITYFASDIGLSTTPSPLGGAAKYSTSQQTFTSPLVNDSKWTDLQTAIDMLLYAGGFSAGTEPLTTERAKYFTAKEAGEINSQLVFMLMAQLGRFLKVYGDASTTGVKGAGSAGNNCFSDYSNTPGTVQTALSSYPGACQVTNSSHPELDSANITVAERRKRLCQGVVLVNSVLDVLPVIIATGAGGDLSSISTVTTTMSTYRSNLTAFGAQMATVAVEMSQSNCESDTVNIPLSALESYAAIIFEAIIQ